MDSRYLERVRESVREVMARSSAPSRYTGSSPVAQYSSALRLGCVVSTGLRRTIPPTADGHELEPALPDGPASPLTAHGSRVVPVTIRIGDLAQEFVNELVHLCCL